MWGRNTRLLLAVQYSSTAIGDGSELAVLMQARPICFAVLERKSISAWLPKAHNHILQSPAARLACPLWGRGQHLAPVLQSDQ